MNGREVFDYTPLRHDLPLESESDLGATTDGYYSDLSDDDTLENRHCRHCLSEELLEKKVSDLEVERQAAQQIALASGKQFEKALLKGQGIRETFEVFEKELNRAMYLSRKILALENHARRLRVEFLTVRHLHLFTRPPRANTFSK